MSLACSLGFHAWAACRCGRCGRIREKAHQWEGCRCGVCGKTRDAEHSWNRCQCGVCGRTRSGEHEWAGCKCSLCGSKRDSEHTWGAEKCEVCGAEIDTDVLARRWADELAEAKDYHALAQYLCTYHHEIIPGWTYRRSANLDNAKRRCALSALSAAGADAVGAILEELEAGPCKDDYVASLLMRIGDVRAVPLLKRLLDRGTWEHIGGKDAEVRGFVNAHPEHQGAVEQVRCAICGAVRPVSDTKQCEDKRFCHGECWSRRGRVVKSGIGVDCPYYSESLCMTAGHSRADAHLCSLQIGSYRTSCHVYAMYPK